MWGNAGRVLYPYVLFKYQRENVDDWLFRHELEHVYQIEREGFIKFHLKYLYYLIRYGYKKNPYEIAARNRQYDTLTEEERNLKNS